MMKFNHLTWLIARENFIILVNGLLIWRLQEPGVSALNMVLAVICNWCWFNSSGAVGEGILQFRCDLSLHAYHNLP
jgi:hypothetical protein